MRDVTLQQSKRLTAALGWVGATLILLAYFLVSFEILRPDQLSWQFMNLFGSIGIVTAALPKKDWPAMWLNVIFAVIALVSLIRIVTLL